MEQLTERQSEILDMIRSTINKTGMPPTRVEIAQTFKFNSPNAAEGHLRALARKGAIKLLSGSSRGIQVVDKGESGIPVVSSAMADTSLLDVSNVQEYYAIDADLFEPKADFAVRLTDSGMKDAGIMDGDLLIASSKSSPRTGQVVVAMLNGKLMVRRLKRTRQREVFLEPQNGRAKPIKVKEKDDFEIEGVAVGIVRIQKNL